MEEVLIVLLQFLFELTVNVLANVPLDWPSKSRSTPEPETVWPKAFIWFVVGCVLGAISLLWFMHTLISISALRMLNVIASPILSGYLSQVIALRRSMTNENIIPRNHFWQAFWFALGLALVRFAYASRTG